MRKFALIPALLLGGCATVPQALPTATVTARAETVPVGTANADAADDPAIWRDEANPEGSLIVATDKKAGLYVYGLGGQVRHFVAAGQLNNVDLIDLGSQGVLVAASDRNDLANAKIQLYRLDTATARLQPLGAVTGGRGEAYGICLWRDGQQLYAFSVLKQGAIEHVLIDTSGATPTGRIVRTLRVATQPEGCVVDPRSGTLFVGEEVRGIWQFAAGASAPVEGSLVAAVNRSQLFADVEGLAIAETGTDGGYLIASSQGDNSYALYRLPDMTPAGRFRVGAGQFGSTEETDGIAFHPGGFGSAYPNGLLVVQDGVNAPNAQNFKLVSWADVIQALEGRR